MDFIEKEANSVEKATELALKELGIEKEQAEIVVVSEKKGIFGKAIVKVCKKRTIGEKARDFLDGLCKRMNIDVTVELTEDDECATVKIVGDESGTVIGYRGDVLDAVQYLTLLVANSGKDYKRVVVDAENYREKRADTLKDLALRLADKAERTGRRIELEPMNPYERRVIHSVLQDSEKASTESHGEEPNRFVVIIPKHEKKYDKKSNNHNHRNDRRQRTETVQTAAPSNAYDPYAPCEDAPKFNFAKKGLKMRSFGYKRGR